jgi:flavin-dependent dehydrogenase
MTAHPDIAALRPIYDVVVVGARCAGAATAMLLARGGLSVLAVDRSPYGSDTSSTHALLRGAMVQLVRWGLADRVRQTGVALVRQTTFDYGGEAHPIEISPRDGVSWLAAPRRTVLDALLVDAARDAGATVLHGPRVTGLLRGPDGRVLGVELEGRDGSRRQIRAGVVVGADGAHSTVASLVHAEPYRLGAHAAGVVYGYWSGVGAGGYEWLFSGRAAVGVIPTNDGAVCVFAGCPAARFLDEIRRDLEIGYFRLLGEVSPPLMHAAASARLLGRLRGFAGEPGWMRQSHGRGWALVGDAGYFKDPITAHGISDALRDAELLARALLTGAERALADYQHERDALSHALFDITDEVASFSWTLGRLEALHKQMSRELNRESAYLAALGRVQEQPCA